MEIEILSEARLRYWANRLGIPLPAVDILADIANQVVNSTELCQVFADFHARTALMGEWPRDFAPLPFDPLVESHLGERASLFYLLAYLAALPSTWNKYQKLGIPDRVFDDTQQDITVKLLDEYELLGRWQFKLFWWIWLHLDCKIFRLGRLQYVLRQFEGQFTAYRKLNSGEILLLAAPNVQFRSDGYADGGAWSAGFGNDMQDQEQSSWYAIYEEQPDGWRGYPVSPYGFALREPVFLSRTDWEPALREGDWVLDLHIPRSGAFTVETCRDSLCQAEAFFPRLWPERPARAWFCHTWFFTPQLQRMLPRESNIVRFQREFYLYSAYPGSLRFLWEFVFGEKYPDRATAPRDTSLRRAVLDWLEGGGEIFDLCGVSFHGTEAWGTQPYMRAWDEKIAQVRRF